MARTRVRHSTQLLRDFALPTTIPEDAGFEEAIPKTPIIQPNSITLTTTGNIDDLDFGNANLIRMNNATLATIRGLKAGADGQVVTIVSIGAGEVDFAHQNAGSVAGNRLINFVTSGITPIAAGVGAATYQYDATTARWRLINHNQGFWIAIPYSAGNFSGVAGTWTVDSGDQTTFEYYLDGNRLTLVMVLGSTSFSGASVELRVTIPNSYTVNQLNRAPFSFIDNGTPGTGMFSMSPGSTTISFFLTALGSTSWAASTNSTNVYFNSFIFVT